VTPTSRRAISSVYTFGFLGEVPMQRFAFGIIGILGLLVLFLAGQNVRLAHRQRGLEEKVAALERQTSRSPAPKPPAERVADPATPAGSPEATARPHPAPSLSAPAASPASTGKPDAPGARTAQSQIYLTGVLANLNGLALDATRRVLAGRGAMGDDVLGLSESQKKVLDDLRKSRDLRTQTYRDQIQQIEDQTDLAIRQVLEPQQLAIYDGLANVQVELATAPVQAQDPPLPGGQRPGYLGVSVDNSNDAGATISQVLPNSTASALGLQVGDVILQFNGEPISSFADLSAKIRSTGEGTPVTLKVRREGSEFYSTGPLGTRPQ
jgi:hypothetical protein